MASEPARGKCLCRSVQFEVSGEPMWVAHCHCHSCRRNTGSAVATFVGFRREQLSYTRGSRKIYESSPGVRRGFCEDCGTPLTYEADECSQVLVDVDGSPLSTTANPYLVELCGLAPQSGATQDTGWQQASIEVSLGAGTHTLTLGGYNNQKTKDNEFTRIYFDDVAVSL